MFSSKKIKPTEAETVIGQGVEVIGDIKFQGALRLDGTITGSVTTADDSENSVLTISESGRIEGDIHVAYAVIKGEVVGNVYTSGKVELSAKSRISGNVEYNLLQMASGSEINGQMLYNAQKKKLLEHQKEVIAEVEEELLLDLSNVHQLDDTTAMQS